MVVARAGSPPSTAARDAITARDRRVPSGSDGAHWDHLVHLVRLGADINSASAKAHSETAERFDALHSWLGIAIIVLSAMTSASLVEAIGQSSASWQKILTATLSTLATAFAGVQAFVKPADKAKAHDRTAREYNAVCGELMGLLYRLELLPDDAHRVTAGLQEKFAEADRRRRTIEESAPRMPARQREHYDDAVRQIERRYDDMLRPEQGD